VRRKFYEPENGEWMRPTTQEGWRHACCDCGLTHKVDFRVVRGVVHLRFWADRLSTAARRREMRKRGVFE